MSMKKNLLSITLAVVAMLLTACGQSQEEKDITKAVHQKYKSEQIDTGTSVPFNILNLEVDDKKVEDGITTYEVKFDIQEMHPSRRYYLKGSATVTRKGKEAYKVGSLYYHENSKLNH